MLNVDDVDGLELDSSAANVLDSSPKGDHDTMGISKLVDNSSVHTSGPAIPQDSVGLQSHPLHQETSDIFKDSQRTPSSSGIPFPPQFYEHGGSGIMRNSGRKDKGPSASSRPLLGQHDHSTGSGRREFKDRMDLEQSLHAVFLQFARFGNRCDAQHLDSFRFMKLCRECCLTTELGDTQCVDLIFYQEKTGSSGQLCAVFQHRPSHFLGSIVTGEKDKNDAFKMYSKVLVP